MLDMFDMCSKDLQEKLRPARTEFKAYEDWLVDQVAMTVEIFSREPQQQSQQLQQQQLLNQQQQQAQPTLMQS